MFRTILIAAAAFAVAACSTGADAPPSNGSPPISGVEWTVPGNLADSTTLDERAGIAATNGYTAASRLGATLARSGIIDREKFKAADRKGYAAVQAIAAAYLASNARSYTEAIERANAAVAEIASLTKK